MGEDRAPGKPAGEKCARKRNGDSDRGIQHAKLMGLNYEPVFNCAPGVCPVVYPINKSARGREPESNAELLNGIMNPPENGGYVEYGAAVCWICAHSPCSLLIAMGRRECVLKALLEESFVKINNGVNAVVRGPVIRLNLLRAKYFIILKFNRRVVRNNLGDNSRNGGETSLSETYADTTGGVSD